MVAPHALNMAIQYGIAHLVLPIGEVRGSSAHPDVSFLAKPMMHRHIEICGQCRHDVVPTSSRPNPVTVNT